MVTNQMCKYMSQKGEPKQAGLLFISEYYSFLLSTIYNYLDHVLQKVSK